MVDHQHSPIVTALNGTVPSLHRWCTPSVLRCQHVVEDPYGSDVSVSASDLGSPVGHTGIFGEAASYAAAAHGADGALLCPHGSSGANTVALRTVALEHHDALVLCAPGVHHSVTNGLKMLGMDYRFLPMPLYDRGFEALCPPSVAEIVEGLSRYPEAVAVIYPSPTYEGLTADTRSIAATVHERFPGVLVIVDEAWGAHLAFHPALPPSAIASGADICVQSTHKMGGSLQQGALLLWKGPLVDPETLMEAYREYTTTSPSYTLLGSVDAAVRALAIRGEAELGRCLDRASELRGLLADRLPELKVLDGASSVDPRGDHVAGFDPLKVTFNLSAYGMSGYRLARALRDRGIVAERAGLNSLQVISTFQLPVGAVDVLIEALVEVLSPNRLAPGAQKPLLDNPMASRGEWPAMRPAEVRRYAKLLSQVVDTVDAVGRIAAETVELYPPGIPVIVEGYRVTETAVAALLAALREGALVEARDPELRTLRVISPARAVA